MRRTIIVILAALLLAATACTKKAATPAGAAETKGAPPVAGNVGDKAKSPVGAANLPADQSSPGAALTTFFAALDVAQNPEYQTAKEPDKEKKYQDARMRLRQLFVSGDSYAEIIAYLDLIKMKRATVADRPIVTGDKATMKVHVFKGDGLELDPMSFGETSKTEADAVVELVKQGGEWKIEDFGGLAAKARARRG